MDLHGGHHWILGGHFRLFTTPLVCCIKNFLIYKYIYLIIVRRYW